MLDDRKIDVIERDLEEEDLVQLSDDFVFHQL